MELVYFVISILEIILTIFVSIELWRASNKVCKARVEFDAKFADFYIEFKKVQKTLSYTAKAVRFIKKYLEKTKDLRTLLKALAKMKGAFAIFQLLFKNKSKKKLGFSILRKLLFI